MLFRKQEMNYTEWTFNEKSPIYIQLAHKLRYSLSSRILSGDNILSIRSMAAMLHLNVNIVARSYSLTNQNGLISTNRNKKYIVILDNVLDLDFAFCLRFCLTYLSFFKMKISYKKSVSILSII